MMESKTEEPKIESNVTYDDRRKVMVQHFKSTQEIKVGEDVVGEAVMTRETTFKEEGIRNILKELSMQRSNSERKIKQMKESMKEVVELTPELKEIEEKIQTINSFNKAKQTKSQLEAQESDLKIIKTDIQEIKQAIGSRLKL